MVRAGLAIAMNVLVACEMSRIVRDAFRWRGHNAYSCDLMPTRRGGPHYRGDVRPHLDLPWDLVIAFPPCTYLTRAAAWRWRYTDLEMMRDVQFVQLLAHAAPRTCIENPHGALRRLWRKPDRVVHPWWFGHPYTKPTCLWLKGLPALRATRRVDAVHSWVRANSPDSAQRGIRRSLTFPGLAQAMAEQWSDDLTVDNP